MTVYELMTFLAEQPAGREVFASVAEGDDKPVVGADAFDHFDGVYLSVEWDDKEES